MKLAITSVFLFVFFGIQAQDYTVEKIPNRYRLSWETVVMTEEPDLGFVGIGFDLFQLVSGSSSVYVGINSYSAMSGSRPGLITLGMSAGWCPQIFTENLSLDVGAFIGGGGGGGAADGGGLIVRPHIALEQRLGDIGLRLGFSRIDFPSGAITGNQMNFGITINGSNYFKSLSSEAVPKFIEKPATNKLRIAMVGTQYFNLKEGSATNIPEVTYVGLIGAQIERTYSNYLYGILKANGAFAGGADGYMSILLGGGVRYPIINNKVLVESRLLFGPSGGGSIESGGGATAQAEIGLSILIGKGYDIKFMTGKTFSPWGDFNSNHMEIGIGKSFDRLFPKELNPEVTDFTIPAKDYNVNHMAFSVYNRTYFPPHEQRKDGEYYLSSFNLLGFEIQKYLGERWTINGGTVWAYQGDYGAYAEGLLGATYHHPIGQHWNLTARAMFGAAGGGAIDLGSGLLFEYSIGVERKLNEKWHLFIDGGKTQPLEGKFTPYSLDVGLKFHLHQLIKK